MRSLTERSSGHPFVPSFFSALCFLLLTEVNSPQLPPND